MKRNVVEVKTQRSVPDVAQRLNLALSNHRADVEPMSSSNPLDRYGDSPEIEIVASRQGMMNAWTVQIGVFDRGDYREVEFHALGQGAGARLMGGTRKTVSLTKSTQIAEQLANEVR